jgi:SpoVK/Ycf46/Vps4 family AAA+-type ATPase
VGCVSLPIKRRVLLLRSTIKNKKGLLAVKLTGSVGAAVTLMEAAVAAAAVTPASSSEKKAS